MRHRCVRMATWVTGNIRVTDCERYTCQPKFVFTRRPRMMEKHVRRLKFETSRIKWECDIFVFGTAQGCYYRFHEVDL